MEQHKHMCITKQADEMISPSLLCFCFLFLFVAHIGVPHVGQMGGIGSFVRGFPSTRQLLAQCPVAGRCRHICTFNLHGIFLFFSSLQFLRVPGKLLALADLVSRICRLMYGVVCCSGWLVRGDLLIF